MNIFKITAANGNEITVDRVQLQTMNAGYRCEACRAIDWMESEEIKPTSVTLNSGTTIERV